MSWQTTAQQESADWVSPWTPPGADLVDTDRMRFFVDDTVATVVRAQPDDRLGVEDLVDEVLTRCGDHGAARVRWTVRPGDVGDAILAVLRRRGAVIDELIDICAWDLRPGPPQIPVPDEVLVRPVVSRDDVVAAQQVDAEVWGYRELTEDEIDQQASDPWPGRFVGFIGSRPAGSAGYGLVESERGGTVARLFGAGVIPGLRGRGVYRGLLAVRLDDARNRGATMALVHARSGTSGPILRRSGFTQVGQQTVITMPVSGSGVQGTDLGIGQRGQ